MEKDVTDDRIPLTRVNEFLQITKTLDHLGTSPGGALRRLRIPSWHHCSPNDFIPLRHAHQLMDSSARKTGLSSFGVFAMEHAPVQEMGEMGARLVRSPNVLQAVKTALKLLPVHGTSRQWWLADAASEVWFCRGGRPLFDVGEAQTALFCLTGMVQIVRMGAGQTWCPSKVMVQAASTLGAENTEIFCNARIILHPSISAIAIPRSVLSLPLRRPYYQGSDGTGESPDDFQEPGPPTDFVGSLKKVIATLLGDSYPSIEVAAQIADLKVRTLQRRLELEGITYRKLVNEVRLDIASQTLKRSEIAVTDLAFELGYSDLSHFIRAFRSWTGQSPTQYRRHHASEVRQS